MSVPRGASADQLKKALDLHRKAQCRLDFVAAENSMGYHASQESARILAEAIDYAPSARSKRRRPAPRPASSSVRVRYSVSEFRADWPHSS
jgi:nitrite reductase (cytochrome c-552)